MEIRVLLFGPAAIAHGSSAARVSVQDEHPLSAAELLHTIASQHEHLSSFATSGRLAVAGQYAASDAQIDLQQELALISMVSGG